MRRAAESAAPSEAPSAPALRRYFCQHPECRAETANTTFYRYARHCSAVCAAASGVALPPSDCAVLPSNDGPPLVFMDSDNSDSSSEDDEQQQQQHTWSAGAGGEGGGCCFSDDEGFGDIFDGGGLGGSGSDGEGGWDSSGSDGEGVGSWDGEDSDGDETALGDGAPQGEGALLGEGAPQDDPDPDATATAAAALLAAARARPPERRRIAHWRALAHEPLYTGSPVTLHQYCFLTLRWKCSHNMSNEAVNASLRKEHFTHPVPNLVPTNLRAVRTVLGVAPHEAFVRHVCLGGSGGPTSKCGLYPATPKADWNKDDCCPHCKTSRFVSREDANGRQALAPRFPPCYYFGVQRSVRELFEDQVWCAERRAPRDGRTNAHTLWGGEYFKRVNQATAGRLFDLHNDAYEVAFDWVQPFKYNNSSEVGVFTLRALGLGTETRGKNKNIKVFMLIATKTKPRHLGPYLSEMHSEFDLMEGSGISVFDSSLKQSITHRGYLLTAVGDTPVLTCFMNAWGHTALWGCWRCFFQGSAGKKLGGNGGVFFLGYVQEALQKHGLFGPFSLDEHNNLTYTVQAPAESAAAVLAVSDAQDTTHALLRALGRHAEAQMMKGATTITTPCVKGRSLFAQRPYFDTRFGVLIPISHCFLYGVVKKFCKLVLPKKPKNKPWEVSAANREAVSARAAHLVLPADSARAYRDIVKYGGSYTMEDYGVFVGTAGLFVLRGLLPGGDAGPLWRIFTLLSRAYHIVFEGTKLRAPGERAEGISVLQEAAELCELNLPHEMCTYNLHTFVRHVLQAESEVGAYGACSELYVERLIREVVGSTRRRATKEVGAFLANELLDGVCVQHLAATVALPDNTERWLTVPAAVRNGANTLLDPPVEDGGDYFSSPGKRVPLAGADGAPHLALLLEYFADRRKQDDSAFPFDLSALVPDTDFDLWRFQTACRNGREVYSKLYNRSGTRSSRFVAIDFAPPHGVHFAEVAWFWMLRVGKGVGAVVVRLARIHVHRRTAEMDTATLRLWGEADHTSALQMLVADKLCELDSIRGVVVKAQLSAKRAMYLPWLKN